MKKLLITILLLCLFASFGMAQHKSAAHKGGLPLNGTTDYVLTWDGLKAIWAAGGGTDSSWTSASADTFTTTRLILDLTSDYLFTERGDALAIQNQRAGAAFSGLDFFTPVGDGSDDVIINIWGKGLPGDITTVSERLFMGYNLSGIRYELFTAAEGTGTIQPLALYTSGNTDQLLINTDGSISQEVYTIRKVVSLEGASDASATNWFTITTTNETGSADGGMYSVHVHLTAGEATAASGAVNTASVGLAVRWTRIMASAGTGANSAVVEIGETASADEGSGAISAVTVTVTETSEFIQQVLLNVNTSGGTFDGFAMVEVVYSDFTTPPVIN